MDRTDQKKSTIAKPKKKGGERKSTKRKNETSITETYALLRQQWYDMFRKLP